MQDEKPDWWIYRCSGKIHSQIDKKLPEPPPWRQFSADAQARRGIAFKAEDEEIELVNAALYLRRPLLITGKPGTGKTSLAYSVARELGLGAVLRWSITTHSTLEKGLYLYDAIARLQDTSLRESRETDAEAVGPKEDASLEISKYLRLGPLGTAFTATKRPRLLLIDEIDKSDIDLPNNLLHLFEEGEFDIPELARLYNQSKKGCHIQPCGEGEPVWIEHGKVLCKIFPLVIMTSNGEREFPPAFLRRCLQLEMRLPNREKLAEIVRVHLQIGKEHGEQVKELITRFLRERDDEKAELATDQLMNAVYLTLKNIDYKNRDKDSLLKALWTSLSASGGG
ncbi:MAG: MoxR family ATPase [Gammaproteobacteria bacterium]|nr:MoxR family ATPase [Gammaproteobacteria bacterium]